MEWRADANGAGSERDRICSIPWQGRFQAHQRTSSPLESIGLEGLEGGEPGIERRDNLCQDQR